MTDLPPTAPPLPDPPVVDVPEEADDDEAPSYIEHRKNGGIHLVIDGRKRRLRTPRMRDYRLLVEAWHDEVEPIEAKSQELQDFLMELVQRSDQREEAGQARLSEEDRARDRQLGQEVRQMTEEATIRWWTLVIQTLGVTDADQDVDADDLPVFLTASDSVMAAIDHWRSVPSRSGVR
jgi:hypothetical protein